MDRLFQAQKYLTMKMWYSNVIRVLVSSIIMGDFKIRVNILFVNSPMKICTHTTFYTEYYNNFILLTHVT